MTQTDDVLRLLRSRGDEGLTPIEALGIIGSFRLAARISDAKLVISDDEEIVTERVTDASTGKTFARYVLRRKRGLNGQATLW